MKCFIPQTFFPETQKERNWYTILTMKWGLVGNVNGGGSV